MSKEKNGAEETVVETRPEEAGETVEGRSAQEESRPESELDLAEEKLQKQEDRYLRLLAEYDNYRRRTTADLERRFSEGMAAAAAALLPVYDNLSRALRQPTTDAAYAEGVALTHRGLVESLAKIGVKEILALSQPFNAETMDAVMHVEDEAYGVNTVAEVFEPGFMIGERVLRHAVVKVAN